MINKHYIIHFQEEINIYVSFTVKIKRNFIHKIIE